jgi:tRNA(fMet)-specific endonuclease VapC
MVSRLEAFEEIYLPFVELGELYAGAFRSAQPEKNLMQIRQFLAAVDVLLPDQSTLEQYGKISAQLAGAGTPIPQNDIWISAIAIQTGIPLVTADRHFKRVAGLSVLVWE